MKNSTQSTTARDFPVEPGFRYPIDRQKLDQLRARKQRDGADFPKIGILIVAYNASQLLVETLRRIPVETMEIIEEIFVFDDFSTDDTFALARKQEKLPAWSSKLRAYRNERNVGYGGNQKIGFDYARKRGMDFVILLHGDGQYAPEYLADLIYDAIEKNHDAVFGSRMMNRWHALRGGMPLYKWVGNIILTAFENMVLGLNLNEFHSGYRMYSTKLLERIPYADNSNGFSFDTEIIIQCHAQGVVPCEIPIPTYYGTEISRVNGIPYAIRICFAVVFYRMHQLGIVNSPKFRAVWGPRYRFKASQFSSHGRVVSQVKEGSTVLDVGCGRGWLAEKLAEKNCRVVGVDREPKAAVWQGLDEYHQTDAEQLDWKTQRRFDYVLLADIIEHIKQPGALLTEAKKYLNPGGKIIASTGNVALWYYRLSLLTGHFNYGPRGILDDTHVHLYTLDTFEKLLKENGYRVTKRTYTNIPFELIFRSTGRTPFMRAVDWTYYTLVKLWPRLFAYQTILEAEPVNPAAAERSERAA